MGSSTKRKPADRLRINKPLDSNVSTGVGVGAGGGMAPQDVNNACPVTIQVKLVRQDVTAGTNLILEGNSLRLSGDTATTVGTVPSAILTTLQTCLGMGINYPSVTVVADKQGVRYAEFSQ